MGRDGTSSPGCWPGSAGMSGCSACSAARARAGESAKCATSHSAARATRPARMAPSDSNSFCNHSDQFNCQDTITAHVFILLVRRTFIHTLTLYVGV